LRGRIHEACAQKVGSNMPVQGVKGVRRTNSDTKER